MKNYWIKNKRVRYNLDTDRDGVPDWKDCRPFDPKRHVFGPGEIIGDTYSVPGQAGYYDEIYNMCIARASKRYPSPYDAVEIAYHITKMKMDEKSNIPRGMHDLKEYQIREFTTSFYYNPAIHADILEVQDRFNDVYFYVDVTGYLHDLSAVKLDERYLKGWMGRKPRILFMITGEDREKLGWEFNNLMSYIFGTKKPLKRKKKKQKKKKRVG